MIEQTFTAAQHLHTEAINAQAAELSRLRELVKEMREAWISLDGLTYSFDWRNRMDGIRRPLIAKADAILKESE